MSVATHCPRFARAERRGARWSVDSCGCCSPTVRGLKHQRCCCWQRGPVPVGDKDGCDYDTNCWRRVVQMLHHFVVISMCSHAMFSRASPVRQRQPHTHVPPVAYYVAIPGFSCLTWKSNASVACACALGPETCPSTTTPTAPPTWRKVPCTFE